MNWLYCDNCRQLYWFSPADAFPVAIQLLTGQEGKELAPRQKENCAKWRCLNCNTVPLTTRIATFSFLKALDFPMFERSWLSAEQLLRKTRKWIFIGYSLPAADYEFKHLLKRVQLSRVEPPEFVVITGGSQTLNIPMETTNVSSVVGSRKKRISSGMDYRSEPSKPRMREDVRDYVR